MIKEITLITLLSSFLLLSACSFQNNVADNVTGNDVISNATTTASATQETDIDQNQDQQYQFVKDYNTTITVGGFVVIANKSYQVGDTVTGQITPEGVKIRIAPHSAINEGEPSSASYQEFIAVPIDYLQPSNQVKVDIENKKILKLNEECDSDLGVCEPGLKCAYPCGIPGCSNVCLLENEQARP